MVQLRAQGRVERHINQKTDRKGGGGVRLDMKQKGEIDKIRKVSELKTDLHLTEFQEELMLESLLGILYL